MKYTHFYTGDREQRLLCMSPETPKPVEVTPKAEAPKSTNATTPEVEAQKRVDDATKKTGVLAKSLEDVTKLSGPDAARDPVGPLSNEVFALRDKAEAARKKAGEGTVLAPTVEKGVERPNWAKILSDAEFAYMNDMMNSFAPDRREITHQTLNAMNPETVKKLANGLIARRKLEDTLGTDLMQKLGTDAIHTMMLNGVPREASANSFGITDQEFTTTKNAIAQFRRDIGSPESKNDQPKPDPLLEKRRGELQAEVSQAKTNGDRIQAQMKLAQLEMSDPNNKNKLGSMVNLALLAYAFIQSIKDGSFGKANLDATALGSGEKTADIIAKSKTPEEARAKLTARKEINQKAIIDLDAEYQAGTKEVAKLTKEIADKQKQNAATPAPSDAVKASNQIIIENNQNRIEELNEQMAKNRESKKVLEEDNKVIDGYLNPAPKVEAKTDAAPVAPSDAIKVEASTTPAAQEKSLTPAEVMENVSKVDVARKDLLSIAADIKKTDPDLAAHLTSGSIKILTDASTGKIQVTIGADAIDSIHKLQQKYTSKITSNLSVAMSDPKPLIDTLKIVKNAIANTSVNVPSTEPVYN